MITILSDAIFAFSWDRFKQPAVLCGIAIMILGMIILVAASKLSDYIIKLQQKNNSPVQATDDKKAKRKDYTWIFKIIAGVVVLIGALLAILII